MKKLHELHCKNGAGSVDIKYVNKTLPQQEVTQVVVKMEEKMLSVSIHHKAEKIGSMFFIYYTCFSLICF